MTEILRTAECAKQFSPNLNARDFEGASWSIIAHIREEKEVSKARTRKRAELLLTLESGTVV